MMRGAGASMARSQVATAQATTTPSARSKAGRQAHSRLRGPSGQLASAPIADPTVSYLSPCVGQVDCLHPRRALSCLHVGMLLALFRKPGGQELPVCPWRLP